MKDSALHLSWYTNLVGAVVLLPLLILLGEGPDVIDLLAGNGDVSTFVWGSIITVRGLRFLHCFVLTIGTKGVFGFLMSIASLLSIKVTSPISTRMVSSQAIR